MSPQLYISVMILCTYINNLILKLKKLFAGNDEIIFDTCCLTRKVNRYLIVKKNMKIGTYGTISLVRDLSNDRLYVCKEFIKKKNYTNDLYMRKLHHEHTIAASLNHANVVLFYELINYKEKWYSIIEYCENGDLLDNFQHKEFTVKKIESVFKQLIEGVSYLHSNGIAHRDLKFENLLLSAENQLKISDFGTADFFRIPFEQNKRLSTGFQGSPPYIAPEVYEKTQYDAEKVDLWSCGIILFAMIFRYFPFKEAKVGCKSYDYFLERRYDKNYMISRLPTEIKVLLLGLIEPDPKKRMSIKEVSESRWMKEMDFKEQRN